MFLSYQDNVTLSPIYYGPDDGSLGPRVDNADAYAYFVTGQPGYWNDGDSLTLVRVAKAKLPNLSGSDYQRFAGGDGSLDANWTTNPASQVTIVSNSRKIGGYAGVWYMPQFNRYLLATWYYPNNSVTSDTKWNIYEAPHPWGPWTLIDAEREWTPGGYYNPDVIPGTIPGATANGTPLTWMFSGDWKTGTYYKFTTVTVVVNTH
jgi:hypothetical protein